MALVGIIHPQSSLTVLPSALLQALSPQGLSPTPESTTSQLMYILCHGVLTQGADLQDSGVKAEEAGEEAGREAEEKPSMEEPLIRAAREARDRVARLEAIISGPQPIPVRDACVHVHVCVFGRAPSSHHAQASAPQPIPV